LFFGLLLLVHYHLPRTYSEFLGVFLLLIVSSARAHSKQALETIRSKNTPRNEGGFLLLIVTLYVYMYERSSEVSIEILYPHILS